MDNFFLELCNGTRLIITRITKYVFLKETSYPKNNVGDNVFKPMLSLTPSDLRIPFKF